MVSARALGERLLRYATWTERDARSSRRPSALSGSWTSPIGREERQAASSLRYLLHVRAAQSSRRNPCVTSGRRPLAGLRIPAAGVGFDWAGHMSRKWIACKSDVPACPRRGRRMFAESEERKRWLLLQAVESVLS